MVKIITDTTACIDPDYAQAHGLLILPQVIHFEQESFFEGINIDSSTFMQRLCTARELPKTAAPPPELFVEQFKRLVPLGEPILCLHPSAEVSGTVRSALTAAQEFAGADIRVLDTRLVASPLGCLVQLAVEWAEAGQSIDTILARLQEMLPRGRIYFLVATLEYLAKGGRIGGASALLGSMLQIKPILVFQDGRVMPFEKERTHRRALARLCEIVYEQYPRQRSGYLSVLHAAAFDQAQQLATDLGDRLGLKAVPIYNMPPAIVVHGGPGILGVGFFG